MYLIIHEKTYHLLREDKGDFYKDTKRDHGHSYQGMYHFVWNIYTNSENSTLIDPLGLH